MGPINVRSLFLLLAMVAFPHGAFGAVINTDLGTLAVGDISLGPVMHGLGAENFTDTYTFQLDGATDISLSGSWTTTPGTGPAGLSGNIFLVFLESPGGTPGIPIATGTIGPGDVFTLAYAGLASMTEYTIRIFGTVPPGGTLTYNANLTVVPLPPALLLFGSALVAMMLFGRIRRRSTQQASLVRASAIAA